MGHDSMRLDAPAAQKELELLKTMTVGSTRTSPLFPALEIDLEWTCIKTSLDLGASAGTAWEFEGRFCDQPLFNVVIIVTPVSLVLDLKEAA